jgi:hypothetical protein
MRAFRLLRSEHSILAFFFMTGAVFIKYFPLFLQEVRRRYSGVDFTLCSGEVLYSELCLPVAIRAKTWTPLPAQMSGRIQSYALGMD